MKLLLDTHVRIWWHVEPARLSATASAAIRDPTNEVWMSVINAWEIIIKAQLGKLSLEKPLPEIIAYQQTNGLRLLPIELQHVLGVNELPPAHKDPFDRLLAAQANTEGAALVTADSIFAQYPVRTLW